MFSVLISDMYSYVCVTLSLSVCLLASSTTAAAALRCVVCVRGQVGVTAAWSNGRAERWGRAKR